MQSFALNNNIANQFIQNLIDNKNNSKYIDKSVLEKSSRLGIRYRDNPNKCLIGYDIEPDVKEQLKRKKLNYSYCITDIDSIHSKLNLTITGIDAVKTFYFRNNKFIFPQMYIAQEWTNQTSEYFKFSIYEPEYFNAYSRAKLDEFVNSLIEIFDVDSIKVNKLKEEKIDYILCRDSDQIEKITGYPARGQFLIASDAIITSYNCHYHEIVHFFINYVLEENNLYTNPFILEGLAVALGGRGGKIPDVILDMGYYLQKKGFLNYKEIQTFKGFYDNNASLSYPLAGLYVKFLLEHLSLDDFLKLYRTSGASRYNLTKLNVKLLPDEAEWTDFLGKYTQYSKIEPHDPENNIKSSKTDTLIITDNQDYYYFWAKNSINLFGESTGNAKSRLIDQDFPDQIYNGENYLLKIFDSEISIYDLNTNNLIANYVNSFDTTAKAVFNINGWYTFKVKKSVLSNIKLNQ